MESTELRLGNIISGGTVTGIVGRTVWVDDKPMLPDELAGQPLTEEWLLKFGFEVNYESSFRKSLDYPKDFRFGFQKSKDLKNISDGVTYRGNIYPEIKYVHQLQNLYFALTGEELTLSTTNQ